MRDDHFVRIEDKVSLIDPYGRKLFTVDRWIWEVAAERGDLARWGWHV